MTELRGITWDHERGIGGLRACAVAYEAADPGVTVRWSVRSLQAFADQSVAELAARFDLLFVDHPAIGAAAASGSLVPLDAHLSPNGLDEVDRASVGASAASYVWSGRRWALPGDAASQVAALRPDLLQRAGLEPAANWDAALELATALRRVGLWAAVPAIPVDAVCAFLALCRALGEEPFADGEVVVSRPTGVAALDILSAFVERSHPSTLEWNPPRMLEHMSEHDDVAYCPLAFGYSNYARAGFRSRVVRFAPPPAGAGGAIGTLGGAGIAVSASTAAIEDAVAFAAFVASETSQRGPYFDGGGQPAHRGAWTDPRLDAEANGFFGDTLTALDDAYLRPRYDGFLVFQDAAGDAIHTHLREPTDAAAVLERVDAAYRDSVRGTS